MLYRNFCERLADTCETEAKAYEEHPGLHDGDCQLIGSLRAKRNEWRQQLQRMEAAHKEGGDVAENPEEGGTTGSLAPIGRVTHPFPS